MNSWVAGPVARPVLQTRWLRLGAYSGGVYAAWRAAGVGASCAGGVTAGSGRDTRGRVTPVSNGGEQDGKKGYCKFYSWLASRHTSCSNYFFAPPPAELLPRASSGHPSTVRATNAGHVRCVRCESGAVVGRDSHTVSERTAFAIKARRVWK